MDSQNGYFEARYTFDGRRKAVWRAITEYLQSNIIGHPRCIVELGPGYGDFINQVKASRRIAVDVADVSTYLDPEIEFHLADASNLSFLKDGEADAVFASNLLEHLPMSDVEAALDEIRRVLRPNGLLALIQPNFRLCPKRYFDDYTHQTIFTDESLCGILRAHDFEIVYRRNRFLPFSMTGKVPKSYLLTKLYLKSGMLLMAKQMLIVGKKRKNVS